MSPRDWLLAAILLLIALGVTGCSMGSTRHCPGIVRQHVYQPAYYTQNCHTDSKGKTTCNQTRHPAEFRLLIYVPVPEHSASIDNQLMYLRYPDGASVSVGERCGRWTGIVYVDWIDDKPQPSPDGQSY